MEASDFFLLRNPCVSGAATDCRSPWLRSIRESYGSTRTIGFRYRKASGNGIICNGFQDKAHLSYYYEPARCVGSKEREKKAIKKRAKLHKVLSKNLTVFSSEGFGLDREAGPVGEVQNKTISEATEILLKQLEHLKAEEKEAKKKRKEEKSKARERKMESSSSSSESSDNDCGTGRREVVKMKMEKAEAVVAQPQQTTAVKEEENREKKKVVEVCMGGKCKKSGGTELMEEFERVMGLRGGAEGAVVVACKCMGKCRYGPNVRVSNHAESDDGFSNSFRTLTNPLCIGVKLQDVEAMVSDFFGDECCINLGCAPS